METDRLAMGGYPPPPGGYGPPPGGYGPPPGGYGAPPGGYGGPPPQGYGPPPGYPMGNPYAPPGMMGAGYYGDMGEAPDAKSALIFSIVGLFCFGFIMGPIAILKARSALQMIRMNPGMRGEGMAIAGMVIGIVDLVLNVIGIINIVAS